MLNRPSKAAVTRVVGTFGALVALCAILILATSAPDLAFAHDPVPAIYHIHYDENGRVRSRPSLRRTPRVPRLIGT